jgi:hypothetical protein
MTWRPIETQDTIPIDQYGVTDRVLLAFPDEIEKRCYIAYKDPYYEPGGQGYCEGSPWVLDSGETIDMYLFCSPTHWMPLPEAPK